jgi:hypothetical protein
MNGILMYPNPNPNRIHHFPVCHIIHDNE